MRDENAEIIFEVTKAPEGGYDAQSIGRGIFIFAGRRLGRSEGDGAGCGRCHFAGSAVPSLITLRYVRDEAIAV